MRFSFRTALSAVTALALAASLAGCAKPAEEPAEEPTGKAKVVKIGFAAPLTGDNAVYGKGMERAAMLALEEANASAEVKDSGFDFQLVPLDDQGDPKQAVNVANTIAGDAEIVGVIGHFNSGCSIPASPVYKQAGLAMVSVSSNPQLTAQGYENVNRIVAKDDAQGAFAGDLVYTDLGAKTVALVDDSTAYGQGLAAEFKKTYEAAGGKVVLAESVQPKDVDFSALITKIKPLKPGAIYYAGALNEGALLSKQAKEAGVSVPLVGGDMLFSEDFIKIAGADKAEGDVATSLGLPLEQQPKGAEFKEKYVAKYGSDPEAYDSYAYDQAWIFVNAVLEAGQADRAAVAKAVRAGSFDGVTGVVEFDENGDNKQQIISAYKVESGAWKQIVK